MSIVHTTASRAEIIEYIRQLPGMLSGRLPDRDGIAQGFKLRMAFAFFSVVKEAFIVKSRGGTDEAGIKWPKLSQKYLAYGRGPASTRTAGGLSPGGKDGFMTEAQLSQWRRTYARLLARLLLQMEPSEAKAAAASVAWNEAKRAGVRTKLDVFGNREVEILRDRGILFNSLSPGVLAEAGPAASYSPPEEQLVEDRPGELAVGTNVTYAGYHQRGRRPMWPPDGHLPGEWWEEILDAGRSGLTQLRGPMN